MDIKELGGQVMTAVKNAVNVQDAAQRQIFISSILELIQASANNHADSARLQISVARRLAEKKFYAEALSISDPFLGRLPDTIDTLKLLRKVYDLAENQGKAQLVADKLALVDPQGLARLYEKSPRESPKKISLAKLYGQQITAKDYRAAAQTLGQMQKDGFSRGSMGGLLQKIPDGLLAALKELRRTDDSYKGVYEFVLGIHQRRNTNYGSNTMDQPLVISTDKQPKPRLSNHRIVYKDPEPKYEPSIRAGPYIAPERGNKSRVRSGGANWNRIAATAAAGLTARDSARASQPKRPPRSPVTIIEFKRSPR